MKVGDGSALKRIKEAITNFYFSLEDKYYSLIDWLVGRGIPADKLVEAIESKGVPSFPVFVITVLLILGGAIWGISSAFGPKEYVITLYGPDGTPLAYTKVYINGEAYVTDGFGQIHLKGIEPPVTVSVPGYQDFEWDPEVGDIYLEAVTKTVRISVKDKSTGKSITAVKITVHGKDESKEFDEAPVEFKIAKVPTEDAITVDEDGYVTVEVISAIYGKTTEKINWNDSAGMVIEKTIYLGRDETAKAGRIVVNIKPENVEGKAYLYRNDIKVMGPLAFQNGVVTFYSVPYGEYEVVLHPVINGTEFSDPANTIYVSHHSRETEASITLVLPGYDGESDEYTPPEDIAKYYVTIKVTDKETGSPVEGAEIRAKGVSGTLAKTNAQGIATIGFSDENAEYNVYVAHPDYSPSEWFVISPKDKKTYEVELEPLPDIGTLKINVVDPSGPVPKAFYQIYLKEGEEKKLILTGNTDDEGRATVTVPAGTLIVRAAYLDGSFPAEKEVNVPKGKEKEVTVFLSSKVNITVNVYSMEKGDKVSSIVRAVDAEGTTWAEGTTTPYSGAILEVPAKWEIKFVVKYGEGAEYQTDYRVFNENGSVDIYVPTENTTEAKLVGIFDDVGDNVYMLGKGKTYSARFLLVCSGSCTFTFSASDGIKLIGESSKKISCSGKVCATEISIPVEADSDKVYGKGGLSVSWSGGSEEYKIPYGFELSSADCSGNLCARIIATDGTKEADTTKLDVSKIYTFYIPFATKGVGDSPTAEVETGDLEVTEEPQGQPVATVSDWTIGIVTFSGTMFEEGSTEVSITVEDVLSKIFTLRFRDESDLPELDVEITPDVIIRGCSSYKIHYALKDSEGNPASGDIMLAYVGGQSYELPGAEGDLEIPTTSDSVEITFYVSNYREKEITLGTTPVTVTGEGDVVLNTAGEWTAGTVMYKADGPEGISISTKDVEKEDKYPYYITIKSTSFSSTGSATLYVQKYTGTISNTSIIKNVTQNATLSYSGSECSIEIPVEITIHEGGGSSNISGEISVSPGSPTTEDDIKVKVSASTNNPGAKIENISLSVSGAGYSESYSCENKSSCEFDIGKLSAGSYVLSATAKDSTGDTWSGSKSIEVLPEKTGDVQVSILSIEAEACEPVEITFRVDPDSGVEVNPTNTNYTYLIVDGGKREVSVTQKDEKTYRTEIELTPGSHRIKVAYNDGTHVGYSEEKTVNVPSCSPGIESMSASVLKDCDNSAAVVEIDVTMVATEGCKINLKRNGGLVESKDIPVGKQTVPFKDSVYLQESPQTITYTAELTCEEGTYTQSKKVKIESKAACAAQCPENEEQFLDYPLYEIGKETWNIIEKCKEHGTDLWPVGKIKSKYASAQIKSASEHVSIVEYTNTLGAKEKFICAGDGTTYPKDESILMRLKCGDTIVAEKKIYNPDMSKCIKWDDPSTPETDGTGINNNKDLVIWIDGEGDCSKIFGDTSAKIEEIYVLGKDGPICYWNKEKALSQSITSIVMSGCKIEQSKTYYIMLKIKKEGSIGKYFYFKFPKEEAEKELKEIPQTETSKFCTNEKITLYDISFIKLPPIKKKDNKEQYIYDPELTHPCENKVGYFRTNDGKLEVSTEVLCEKDGKVLSNICSQVWCGPDLAAAVIWQAAQSISDQQYIDVGDMNIVPAEIQADLIDGITIAAAKSISLEEPTTIVPFDPFKNCTDACNETLCGDVDCDRYYGVPGDIDGTCKCYRKDGEPELTIYAVEITRSKNNEKVTKKICVPEALVPYFTGETTQVSQQPVPAILKDVYVISIKDLDSSNEIYTQLSGKCDYLVVPTSTEPGKVETDSDTVFGSDQSGYEEYYNLLKALAGIKTKTDEYMYPAIAVYSSEKGEGYEIPYMPKEIRCSNKVNNQAETIYIWGHGATDKEAYITATCEKYKPHWTATEKTALDAKDKQLGYLYYDGTRYYYIIPKDVIEQDYKDCFEIKTLQTPQGAIDLGFSPLELLMQIPNVKLPEGVSEGKETQTGIEIEPPVVIITS